MYMKYEYINKQESWLKDEFRRLFKNSEEILDSDCSCYAMSDISSEILFNTDFEIMCTARHNNYKYLINNFIAESIR